ncbi:MAG: hypothetical protein USCAAHI_00640 [Beijerinckiaceae bacterium]|nr:MAG: hypothetical protein USCAAHI_00640 [Beijerinckiaceae bacterium]
MASVNAYSGNNGRAAILNDRYGQNIYYTVGNAGNGSGTEPTDIVDNTGVQIAQPLNPNVEVMAKIVTVPSRFSFPVILRSPSVAG